MSIEIPSNNEGSRDSTASNQSSGSGSTISRTSVNSVETSSMTPDTSSASIDSTRASDPTPAAPRKQKSGGILNLARTPSASRLRSASSPAVPPVPVPPLPTEECKVPKSILTASSSLPSLDNQSPTTPILHRALSVQFAPLPELAPRRRKSSVPLGIAARSQLMQRRRRKIVYGAAAATFDDPNSDDEGAGRKKDRYVADGGGMWTKEEAEEHLTRQLRSKEKEKEKLLKKQEKELEKEAARNQQGGAPDDPLVVFGRMMKDAWRKVGKKDKGKAAPDPQTRTQAQVELDPSPVIPASVLPPPSESVDVVVPESGSHAAQETQPAELPKEDEALIQEDEEKFAEIDAEIDPNEVDVSKINPLRPGSPPPSAQASETSSVADTDGEADSPDTDPDGDPDSSDTDSLGTMISPTGMSPTETTPTANNFASAQPSCPQDSSMNVHDLSLVGPQVT